MAAPAGFEGIDELSVPPDVQQGFERLDRMQDRRELYSDFCVELGDLLMGPTIYCEASEPFMPPGVILRALSEPTTNKEVRRISIDTFLTSAPLTADEIGAEARPTSPQIESVHLRDYLVDMGRRTMRIGESTVGKRMDGRLAMTSKNPTLLEPSTEANEEPAISVIRGARFEANLFYLPHVTGLSEIRALQGLLKLQPFLSITFQQQVALRFHYAQNDVAY